MDCETGVEQIHFKGDGNDEEECKMNLREKLAALLVEIRKLNEKDALTDEEKETLGGKLTEAEECRAAIEREDRTAGLEEFAKPEIEEEKPELRAGDEEEKIEVGRNRAAEKPYSEGTRGFGEYLQDVYESKGNSDAMARVEKRAITGMGVSVPQDGGFLVGTDHSKTLLEKTYDTSEILSLCFKMNIGPGSDSIDVPSVKESSRADGSRQGGVQAHWKVEAQKLSGSKPKLAEVELRVNDLTGMCYVTDNLLQDASSLGAFIDRVFADEFAFKLNDGIIRGDANGQPLGILEAACKVAQAKESGQVADTVVTQNIVKMWSRMYGPCRKNAVWLINQDIEPQLYLMSVAVGTGGSLAYMPAGGLSGSPHSTLMGRPVVPLEQCATLGDAGDIILADFSQYLIADKGSMESASSIHIRFDYRETAFRFVYRFDGRPWWHSALTPFKGTATQSPFITLAARA